MKQLHIKPITPADAAFLHRLMNTPTVLRALHAVPTTELDWTNAIACWHEDADEQNWIVWKEEEPVGWFSCNHLQAEERIAYLKMAALVPEEQHRGVGTYMVRWLTDTLRQQGYRAVRLYTDQVNHPAIRCYQKCGFVFRQALTQTMEDGAWVPRYQMECRLL